MRRLMPERHLFTGHASRHLSSGRGEDTDAVGRVEALPKWQPGQTDPSGKYLIAKPALLDANRLKILG